MKKKFTLVELIITILVLSILALIILVNIKGLKKDASSAAYNANAAIIQTAVDRYYLDNNLYPTFVQPVKGGPPQLVDYDKLVTKYLKTRPKQDFWVLGDSIVDPTDISNLPTKDDSFIEKINPYKTCAEAISVGYDKCITNEEELDKVREGLNLRYILMNDIDLSSRSNWKGIGGEKSIVGGDEGFNNPFIGELNGNGFKIKNLNIESTEKVDGLFAVVEGATLQNIYLSDINVSGVGEIGGLVGMLNKPSESSTTSTVNNIIVTGKLKTTGDSAGGLIGINEDASVQNVKSFVNIDSNGDEIGGIIGLNIADDNDKNNNLHYKGTIKASGEFIGGVIGLTQNEGRNMSSVVEITAINPSKYLGGVLGGAFAPHTNLQSHGKIISNADSVGGIFGIGYDSYNGLYANVEVSGNNIVGGLIGQGSFGGGGNSFSLGKVNGNGYSIGGLVGECNGEGGSNVYALGDVINIGEVFEDYKEGYTGGLIGLNNSCVMKDSFAKGNVTNKTGYTGGLYGQNNNSGSTNIKAFGNVKSGGGYTGGLIGMNNGDIANPFANGSVTSSLGDYVGGLIGMNNSNISGEATSKGPVKSAGGYTGGLIGMNNGNISGNISSKGDVISSGNRVGGLIGQNNSNIEGDANSEGNVNAKGDNVGGLIGYNVASIDGNISVKGNTFSEGDFVGGAFGYTPMTPFNIQVIGNVESKGSNIGGLIGLTYSDLENSYYKGKITSTGSKIGGLVGESSGGIKNSYVQAQFEGKGQYMGALIGYNDVDIYPNPPKIENTYAAISILDNSTINGFIGYIKNKEMLGIVNSHWDSELSKVSTTNGEINSTTEELKKKATYTGWDFINIWDLRENESYPTLKNLK